MPASLYLLAGFVCRPEEAPRVFVAKLIAWVIIGGSLYAHYANFKSNKKIPRKILLVAVNLIITVSMLIWLWLLGIGFGCNPNIFTPWAH